MSNHVKIRTSYILVPLRRDSMLTEVLEKEVVVLDSLNLAGFGKNKSGLWNWNQVIAAAEHYRENGHRVICVSPEGPGRQGFVPVWPS